MSWAEEEFGEAVLGDMRLTKRRVSGVTAPAEGVAKKHLS